MNDPQGTVVIYQPGKAIGPFPTAAQAVAFASLNVSGSYSLLKLEPPVPRLSVVA